MKISLIICTYMRPDAVVKLLTSVNMQTYPLFEVLIVDASTDNRTELSVANFGSNLNIHYISVPKEHRGLTRQRNYGLKKVADNVDIIAFLDDDLLLEPDYFEAIVSTYVHFPDAVGVGGIDLKENLFVKKEVGKIYSKFHYFEMDGWVNKEPARYKLRKVFKLMPDLQPGIIPAYSHGRSTFPPNGVIYPVEHFMGGIASYRKMIFEKIQFSRHFEGYGLYEDFDFTVRASRIGPLFVNTNAKVWHYHDPGGRPNLYKYGKMVVTNGWYVWRVRFPNPSITSRIQWNLLILLLSFIRLGNVLSGTDRKGAWDEFRGRITAYFKLIVSKPEIRE